MLVLFVVMMPVILALNTYTLRKDRRPIMDIFIVTAPEWSSKRTINGMKQIFPSKTESTTNFLLYYLEKEKILLVKIIKLEKI